MDTNGMSRRRALGVVGGGAAAMWAAPAVLSLSPAGAQAGSPPPGGGGPRCLDQSFTQGFPQTYTPGLERSFAVDLGATFSNIDTIQVRLHESAENDFNAPEMGVVRFQSEANPHTSFGVVQAGSPANPHIAHFVPDGGHPTETYEMLFLDGRATIIVGMDSQSPGSFVLTSVVVEVCGTVTA